MSRKIKAEIDRVIGKKRPSNLDDGPHMPYTKAFLMEVHRYTSEVPIGAPHSFMNDVRFEGFDIKQDSIIFPNLWSIHHDENLWHDPWIFHPERFLDATGKLLPVDHTLRQALIPFSIGKRACAGQTLAMTRTFLYLTRIIQEFDIKPPSSGRIPNTDPRHYNSGGVIRVEYLCKAIPRHNSGRDQNIITHDLACMACRQTSNV